MHGTHDFVSAWNHFMLIIFNLPDCKQPFQWGILSGWTVL